MNLSILQYRQDQSSRVRVGVESAHFERPTLSVMMILDLHVIMVDVHSCDVRYVR